MDMDNTKRIALEEILSREGLKTPTLAATCLSAFVAPSEVIASLTELAPDGSWFRLAVLTDATLVVGEVPTQEDGFGVGQAFADGLSLSVIPLQRLTSVELTGAFIWSPTGTALSMSPRYRLIFADRNPVELPWPKQEERLAMAAVDRFMTALNERWLAA